MKKKNVFKLTQMAMLAAISVVVLYVIPVWSIFPSAPFLQYDAADVPIIVGAILFGPLSGMAILVVTSFVQAITVSAASGWIGFLMHVFATGTLVIVSGLIYKKKPTTAGLTVGLFIGSLAWTLSMIPLNLIFTGYFLGAGMQAVIDLLPVIIAFNLIKSLLNSALSFLLFKALNPILSKVTKRLF